MGFDRIKRIKEWKQEQRRLIEQRCETRGVAPSFSVDGKEVDCDSVEDRSLRLDLNKVRCNSAGRNIMIRKMDNKSLIDYVYNALENVGVNPNSDVTYDEAVMNILVPELLDRLEDLENKLNEKNDVLNNSFVFAKRNVTVDETTKDDFKNTRMKVDSVKEEYKTLIEDTEEVPSLSKNEYNKFFDLMFEHHQHVYLYPCGIEFGKYNIFTIPRINSKGEVYNGITQRLIHVNDSFEYWMLLVREFVETLYQDYYEFYGNDFSILPSLVFDKVTVRNDIRCMII